MVRWMVHQKIYSLISSVILVTGLVIGVSGPDFTGRAAASGFPCLSPFRIMPLGDSITAGKTSGVVGPKQWTAYRKELYERLQAAGYQVDFVGSESNGSYFSGFDPQHEGHGGWRDDEIA